MSPHPLTLGDYGLAIHRWRWAILGLGLMSMIAAAWLSERMTPIYKATAVFYVPTNAQAPALLDSAQNLAQGVLKSTPDEPEAGLIVGVLASDQLRAAVHAHFPARKAETLDRNVVFGTTPQFFTQVSARDRDPQVAAALANRFVAAYRDFHTAQLRAQARWRVAALEDQQEALLARLAQAHDKLREGRVSNRILSNGEATERLSAQRTEIEAALVQTRADLATLQSRLGAGAAGAPPPGSAAASSPLLESIRRLEARQEALRARLAAVAQFESRTIGVLGDLQLLSDERDLVQDILAAVRSRLLEARVQSETATALIVIVQYAAVPSSPGFPIPPINALIGAAAGLWAGCQAVVMAVYLSWLRRRRLSARMHAGSTVTAD